MLVTAIAPWSDDLHAGAGSGTIDVKEMKTALQSMGHSPSDEELFAIVHEVRGEKHNVMDEPAQSCR